MSTNIGDGENTTRKSTKAGSASGNAPVAAPADAAPDAAPSSVGAPDVQGVQNVQAVQTPQSAGFALRLTVDGHTHAGVAMKKHQTVMLDPAEYRWALQNKIGVPGNADDAGFDVDADGNVIRPQTDEQAIAELEAAANKPA